MQRTQWPLTVRPWRVLRPEPCQPVLPGFKPPCPWCGRYDCGEMRNETR